MKCNRCDKDATVWYSEWVCDEHLGVKLREVHCK
jgi:hypothetical protein